MKKKFYPLLIDLENKHILVLGAGRVALRKIENLLLYNPKKIHVIDPFVLPSSNKKVLKHPAVLYEQREFSIEDCLGKTLVFAATNNTEINQELAQYCAAHNILCNIADNIKKSSFIVPATLLKEDICISISTQGASPALAKRLKIELEEWLGEKYTCLALLLRKVRPLLLAQDLDTEHNTKIFRTIVYSPLADLLVQKKYVEAQKLLSSFLPTQLQPFVGDLIREL